MFTQYFLYLISLPANEIVSQIKIIGSFLVIIFTIFTIIELIKYKKDI